MVLEKLGESLKNTIGKIAKSIFVDDKLLDELVKDIQRSLLQSDVNVKLVFELSNSIKERAKKEDSPKGITKQEHLINIVYEELVKFLGGEKKGIDTEKSKPFKIMLVGLFGSGKTTTAGKLAKHFSKRGKKIALLGLDTYRPAATAQLEQVGKQAGATVLTNKTEKDALKIYKEFETKINEFDIVIIDTAGRDALNDELINEIKQVTEISKPDERFLVISADIGQAAQKQAETFHESCGITGVIASKMDGTAKGGGVLSACAVTGAPIVFIGVGEKQDDLENFNPKGFVSRLLGMGDLEALLEKTKEAITEDEAKDMQKKLMKGEFNLIDLYNQMQAVSKMGPLSKVIEMIPGLGQANIPKEVLKSQEGKLDLWKIAMSSMTKKELEHPDIIDSQRVERISKGAGLEIEKIRDLLKQYKQSKKLVKMMKGGSPEKLMKKFGVK